MATKIYKTGNIIVLQRDSGREQEDHAANVHIYKAPAQEENRLPSGVDLANAYIIKGEVINNQILDVTDLVDENSVAYTETTFKEWYRTNTGFNPASGGSGAPQDPINYRAENYTALVALATSPELNQLGYVRNSEGTKWRPNFLGGGDYYPAGIYAYNGTDWISDRNDIAEQLQINIDDIDLLETAVAANDADILALQSGLSAEVLARINADTNLQNQITTNDTDILNLQNSRLTSILGGLGLTVDNTDPLNPVVNLDENECWLIFANGTIPTALTQNVWVFFDMATATLNANTVENYQQLAGFPDTIEYVGQDPVKPRIVSSLDLRRKGGGQNTYQVRWMKNNVQYGEVKQFEVGGVDASVTVTNMVDLVNGDIIWTEIRNITDNDDVLLLSANITVK